MEKPVTIIFLAFLITIVAAPVSPAFGETEPHSRLWQRLESYKPTYLLHSWYLNHEGTDQGFMDQEVQIQISVKKRLIWHLYFAYTQRMFWQVYDFDQSRSFREINYNPEFFLAFSDWWRFNDIRLGIFEHESNGDRERYDENGQPVNDSRAWNRAYVYVKTDIASGFQVAFKAWILTSPKSGEFQSYYDDNPDLQEYMGSGELTLLMNWGRFSSSLLLRRGWQEGTETARLNTKIPLSADPESGWHEYAVFVQAFTGYGDSLIDYNRKITRIAIGFSLN